jgi:hypothetical protein
MGNEFRSVPRYFVLTALPAKLGGAAANIVDLSLRGARVQSTQLFAMGTPLLFEIQSNLGTISVQATVEWCRMAALSLDDEGSDRYLCGVRFEHEMPVVKHVIDDLLATDMAIRIEDARSTERYTITTQITGSFGVHSPVRILDLSTGGARISTDRMVPAGSIAPLRFRIDRKNIDLNAEMVWCRPAERRGGFEAGLKIEGEELLLRQVIAQLCTKNYARIDLHSLRRKFNPMRGDMSGLLALV